MTHVNRGADEERAAADRVRLIGWVLVGVQALLLILFVLLPKRRSLFAPPDFLDVLGIVLMVGGLALVIV